MIPEDRRQAQARARSADDPGSKFEQFFVLLAATIALLGFLLI